MSTKQIEILIDEESGEANIEAHGFQTVNGVCKGMEATKEFEDALGGFESSEEKKEQRGSRQLHGSRDRARKGVAQQ